MPLSWTLDKIGPICRTAEDCGLVLHEIAGGDSNDPGSAGKSFYFAPQFAKKLSEMKIGFAAVDSDWADADMRPALAAAMATLRETGATLVEVKVPEYPWGAMIGTIIGAEGSSVFEPLITGGQVNELADPSQIEGLKAGLTIPAAAYLKAMRARTMAQRSFKELFQTVDMLVAPARYGVAPKVSEPLDAPSATTSPNPSVPGMRTLIPAGNLAGLPAVSFPCGFAAGLPVGMQLVGPAFRENALLAVAIEFQRRTDFHKRRPVVG
jgi:aspartyl-tRNA(Asn)/glutamyl-tRNA(Gln) amidotransferase subunit A